jgi:tRNA G18 (ribose-2'-O)-methylase SpoU
VGTSSHNQSREVLPLHKLSLHRPLVIVLGNEGYGVRKNILNRCETLVTIASKNFKPDGGIVGDVPGTMASLDLVDSLNVSVCGGIILHHILLNSCPQ